MIKKDIQHGDVSLKVIPKLPKGVEKIKHNGKFTVAEGEATGHCHIVEGEFDLYQDEQGRYYFAPKGKTEIKHWNVQTDTPAEHRTLPLVPDVVYEVDYEVDYNPFTEELSKVID